MAPVTLMLRATDTTTGEMPLMAQESIDITMRPNLKTPVINMVDGNVSTTGRRATILAPVAWSDIAASCLAVPHLPHAPGLVVRRRYRGGDDDGRRRVSTTSSRAPAPTAARSRR